MSIKTRVKSSLSPFIKKNNLFTLMLLASFFSTTLHAKFYYMSSKESIAVENINLNIKDPKRMVTISDTLEIIKKKQLIGLRFNEVNIPVDSNITSAKIRFTAIGDNDKNVILRIVGELSDDANYFSINNKITGRTRTSGMKNTVRWKPGSWTKGKDYYTPDISNIIQKIVNQKNFSGNGLVIIINKVSGCGGAECIRRAYSVVGNQKIAARLEITYIPSPGISIRNSHIIKEGNTNEKTYQIPVTIDRAPSGPISISYNTSDGTAVADDDYNSSSGTLEFDSNTLTQDINITIRGDKDNEIAETFNINLFNIQRTGKGKAHLINNSSTITIANDDNKTRFCAGKSDGFYMANPFNDINKSIEIYCTKNRDFIALPNNNRMNNFVFTKGDIGQNKNYYKLAKNGSKSYKFIAIEINAYTLEVIFPPIPNNSSNKKRKRLERPQKIKHKSLFNPSYRAMASTFSNINLIGTPFAINWENSTITDCNSSKLRKGYYGQTVKINTLDYDNAICKINNMQLKLLDDYRFLEYNKNEVLEPSCKLLAEKIPLGWLASEDIKGHYWIKPNDNNRTANYDISNADLRPLVAYCWYQPDLDFVWTFLLNLDAKQTIKHSDLTDNNNSCSQLGLFPFVPNSEETFERVRKFLVNNKAEWDKYTGTIQEKVTSLGSKVGYYLPKEQNSLIWPYGSFGVYYPTAPNNPTWGRGASRPGFMAGAPMHNIRSITKDYPRLKNDENNNTRDYYSYGIYSNTDSNTTPLSGYDYNDTMGAKGWISILGSADLNKTDEWFISRTGAGYNLNSVRQTYPYFEPNGNYIPGAWLNFLFDSNGRVRHNDDADANYPYYDYMCMAEDNYDFIKRYKLSNGPFKIIEHNVTSGQELNNLSLTTKIVNGPFEFDVIILTDNLKNIQPDKNVSAGIFLNKLITTGLNQKAEDIVYLGSIADYNKSTGRFQIIGNKWPKLAQVWKIANKQLFFKFKYCKTGVSWKNCWHDTLNGGKKDISIAATSDSDYFAIRPKKFNFNITGIPPYKAGTAYNVNFEALDALHGPTINYNSKIPFDYNVTKSNCLTGKYKPNPENIAFKDGTVTTDLIYNEVGSINIRIEEKLKFEFAKIDDNDTDPDQRFIKPFDKNLTYSPDHFNIVTKVTQGSTNFTYMSSDLNMSVKLDINITAKDQDNNTTKNYGKACYSKPTSYNIAYSNITVDPAYSITKMLYTATTKTVTTKTVTTKVDTNSTSINKDINISKISRDIFVEGDATIQVLFNFDRNNTKVVEPFILHIENLNVTDTDSASGVESINKNVTFYYGRVHADDQTITGKTGLVDVYYEIYCKDCNRTKMNIRGEEGAYSADWFRNTQHGNSDGNVSRYKSIGLVTFGNTSGSLKVLENSANITNGVETVELLAPSNPYKDKIDMNSTSWLINKPTDFIVDFISDGQWAGEGKIYGVTVDLNISKAKNRRLDW